jgi:Flp pilus assembly protein TadG
VSPRGRDDRGQAAVELVLVLPLLVLVALAALQVALVGRDQLLVVHAAREAARTAALGGTGSPAAAATTASGLEDDRLHVAIRPEAGGALVRATVTYEAPTEVPLVGALVGDVRLRAAVTMRFER